MVKVDPEKVATEEWKLMSDVLKAHNESYRVVDLIGLHFKQAFVKGFILGQQNAD